MGPSVSHRKNLAGHICHAKINTQKNLRCIPEAACYGATDDKFFCVFIFALQICPASFFLWDNLRPEAAAKHQRVAAGRDRDEAAGPPILSKNVPTPELSCRFAATGRFVMRIHMRGISNRVLRFVMLSTGRVDGFVLRLCLLNCTTIQRRTCHAGPPKLLDLCCEIPSLTLVWGRFYIGYLQQSTTASGSQRGRSPI